MLAGRFTDLLIEGLPDGLRSYKGIERDVAPPLGMNAHDAAAAILELAIARMVSAIEEITLDQGSIRPGFSSAIASRSTR